MTRRLLALTTGLGLAVMACGEVDDKDSAGDSTVEADADAAPNARIPSRSTGGRARRVSATRRDCAGGGKFERDAAGTQRGRKDRDRRLTRALRVYTVATFPSCRRDDSSSVGKGGHRASKKTAARRRRQRATAVHTR